MPSQFMIDFDHSCELYACFESVNVRLGRLIFYNRFPMRGLT